MALIRYVQSHSEALAKQKQIQFRVDCRFPLPARIKSDPTRIRQILNNLCSNAIKYTHEGSVKLIVRWDAINQQMCFDVEDSGIGLTQTEIRKLLGQNIGDVSLNASMTGGLGIAITRHLVRLLGGQLQIDSRKGYGSRFTATIACKTIGKEEWIKHAQTPASTTTAKGVPQLQGNVLLAEDNVVNQKLILRLISKTGATVTLAENGQQAVELARAHHFDLVLMDINMPVMDGLTATRLLLDAGFTSPIYALTAEHGAEEIQACIAAGCLGHLTKPIDVADFYSRLVQHLAPAASTTSMEKQQ
jgi:CheY-like chemotaxis protein/anti-sigma regulatory factor (Ser/Thr protein kinase)